MEYPRSEHVKRITKKGIIVKPLDELLRAYINLLYEELRHQIGKKAWRRIMPHDL